jgi:DNA-binding NarL/FixJ family response regulator
VRIVIAEDMALLRAGLAQLLTAQGIEVVGEAGVTTAQTTITRL